MKFGRTDTALFVIDPQNDVLSETGVSWGSVAASAITDRIEGVRRGADGTDHHRGQERGRSFHRHVHCCQGCESPGSSTTHTSIRFQSSAVRLHNARPSPNVANPDTFS